MPKNYVLVLLNQRTLYVARNGRMYEPLWIERNFARGFAQTTKTKLAPSDSCIETISTKWREGKLMITAQCKQNTKCSSEFHNITPEINNEACFHCLCNGKCTDRFVRNILAEKILPKLYKNTQK